MTVTPDPADPIDVVQRFLGALAEGDTAVAGSLVADELVYANVSLPTIRGKHRFTKAAALYFRHMGFDVRVHRIAANGPVVLTERTGQIALGSNLARCSSAAKLNWKYRPMGSPTKDCRLEQPS